MWLYFGDRVLEEYTLSGVASLQSASYVYGLYVDEVLQMKRDTDADGTLDATYYYHADDQYNVFALTDETGAVVERYDYGDFGAPEFYAPDGTPRTESAVGNPYLFTGRRYDPETQWYYYRTRYYQPLRGQFTTLDAIGVWGDPLNMGNGYAYCGNNPWSFLDPYGLAGGLLDDFMDWLRSEYNDHSDDQEVLDSYISRRPVNAPGNINSGVYDILNGGAIPGRKSPAYPDAARFARDFGLMNAARSVSLAFVPVGFLASPVVVFTADGLFVLADTGDGKVDDWTNTTFFIIGGAGGLRRVACGDEVEQLIRTKRLGAVPTYAELRKLKIRGFEAHHILPKYLGRMLGYTDDAMEHHPGIYLPQPTHVGRGNEHAFHKFISKYLPWRREGIVMQYTDDQIRDGLRQAYGDLGRPELFDAIENLVRYQE